MYSIYEPVSGEKGYFCSEQEKVLIDTIINQLVVHDSSATGRGVRSE